MDREAQEAFRDLVRRDGDALARTGFLLTGDWARGEDLTRSALAATWARWRSLRAGEAADAYAVRSLARRATAWWRPRRVEVPADAVTEALATLPPRQRAVVVLCCADGLTEAETAAALGIPATTVRNAQATALTRLRALGIDEHRLRSAVGGATGESADDRARAVFALVRRRRQQRLAAVACAAVLPMFLAVASTPRVAPAALHPGSPEASPAATATAEPAPSESASPAPGDPGTADPSEQPTGSPDPAATDAPGSPIPIDPDLPLLRPVAPHVPVDVYVLLDDSGDMPSGSVTDPVLRTVYDGLVADGVDLRWGLATFRDQVLGDPGHGYVRVADLGAGYVSTADLNNAGGGDRDDDWTFALDGVLGVGHFPYTRSGKGASFRPEARKVVLFVSNAPMRVGVAPSLDSSLARLNAAGVTVVAIQPTTSAGPDAEVAEDLGRLVRGTGGVVSRPVDCDGDGTRDVGNGEPLVCDAEYDGTDLTGLADAMVRLVSET